MSTHSTETTYDKNAQSYAEVSLLSPPWLYFDRPVLDADLNIDLTAETSILELGCGAGKVMSYLIERGVSEKSLVGADISAELLSRAAEIHPNATFINQDITMLQPRSFAFDVIMAIRVFEYLSIAELARTLRFCFSSLKKRGIVFMIMGHPIRVNGPDISTYQQRGARQHTAPGNVPIELHHKTISDYVNIARDSGFTIDLMRETGPTKALQKANPSDYERYASYGAVTLVMQLSKL